MSLSRLCLTMSKGPRTGSATRLGGRLAALLLGAEDTTTLARVAVVLYGIFAALMAFLPSPGILHQNFADDAFYYLEIARRFGDSPWPTFDGRHITTGFHPLWLFLLVGLEKCLPDDPWLIARVARFVSAMFLLGAIVVFGRLVGRLGGPRAGAITIALLAGSPFAARLGLLGMESPLSALLVALLLSELFGGRQRPVAAGILAGLAVLARLDTVFFLAAAAVVHTWKSRRLGPPTLATAVAACVVSPCLSWFYLETGHLTTNSAAMKSLVVRLDADLLYGGRLSVGYFLWGLRCFVENARDILRTVFGGIVQAGVAISLGAAPLPGQTGAARKLIAPSIVLLVAAGWALARRAPQKAEPDNAAALRPLLLALTVGTAAHLVATSFLVPGQSAGWYWASSIMTVALALAWFQMRHARGARVVESLAWANVLSALVLVVATITGYVRGKYDERPLFITTMTELAADLERLVPEGERVGSCNAGVIGYVSRRGIVNLDGLVNGWSYKEAREKGELRSWIQRDGIQWFVDCLPRDQRKDYTKMLGIEPEEIEVVKTIENESCEGQLWHIHWSEAR
jgi:Dolichyl-phosphate-mannose-protein mannosyltransferase